MQHMCFLVEYKIGCFLQIVKRIEIKKQLLITVYFISIPVDFWIGFDPWVDN